jgi:hypothetical protein
MPDHAAVARQEQEDGSIHEFHGDDLLEQVPIEHESTQPDDEKTHCGRFISVDIKFM